LILTIKRGDTRNGITAILKDAASNPVDLTNANAEFYMSNGIVGTAQVLDAVGGKVMYPLNESVTGITGIFNAEFKVIYADNRIETFPSEGFIKIIVGDLNGR
jgi:hypothetical protein